jgi:hypothetical protein
MDDWAEIWHYQGALYDVRELPEGDRAMTAIEDRARIFAKELMSEPWPLPARSAAAVTGNAWQENLIRPVTIGKKDHGSDGALQWRLGRLTALQKWPGWKTLPVQARFFKAECRAEYPVLWEQLVAGDRRLETLVANVCDFYERPSKAGRELDKRIEYARRVEGLISPTKVPEVLHPVVNGPGSTALGVVSWLAAWLMHKGIILGHDPWIWIVVGVMLIFMIGPRAQSAEEAPQNEEELPMDLLRMITVIETIVPILEKVIARLPEIENDLIQLKSAVVAMGQQPQADPAVDQRLADLVAKIQNLGAR